MCVAEGAVRVNARIQRGGLARCAVILAQRQIRLVQLVEVAAVAANRQACVGLHKAVDGNCPLLARGNRVNGKPRPGADVAADENVRLGGLVGQRVGHSALAAAQLNGLAVEQIAPLDALADA